MKAVRRLLYTCVPFVTIAVLAAGCGETERGSSAADEPRPMLRRTVEHDGIEREYFVHLPQGGGDELPVVVAIHGYTSTATGFQLSHGMNRHADDNGYIVVIPQGTHFRHDDEQGQSYLVTSWNDLAANMPATSEGSHCTADSTHYPCPPECGQCTRCGWTSCYDDVGFVGKMLDEVRAEFNTDTSRTYLLGVSNGGMMALRLGCNLPGRFAAIAPIIGQLAPGYACGPDADLPMMHLFGGADDTVRFDGTPGTDGFIYTSATRTAEVWAAALHCRSGPDDWQNSIASNAGLTCTAYSDCRVAGQEVVSCMDPDGTHAWPEQRVDDLPATCVTAEQYASIPNQAHCPPESGDYVHSGMDLIWQFFTRYRSAAD